MSGETKQEKYDKPFMTERNQPELNQERNVLDELFY